MSEKFKFGISKDPRPNRKVEKKPDKKSGKGIDRRTFLKASAAVGTVAAAGVGGRLVWNSLSEKGEKEKTEGQPTAEQQKIEQQDKEVMGSTIEEQLRTVDKVTLNRSTKKAIQEKWRKSYSPEGENYFGLTKALEKMTPWIGEMKAVFAQVGVPEEYAYLAIPESHFDVKAVSRKYAGGPFQFITSTAKSYNLFVSDSFDQRFDPIASAEACARHLRDSYERFNNDWDLALADYNGAYTNQYAEFRKNKKERNYDDYLAWREGRINNFILQPHFVHEIKKSDKNITKIAGMYGLSVAELMKFNNMKDDLIVVGKKLKLPPKISVKMKKLDDSLENLNYPEKFYAVLEVLEQEDLFLDGAMSSKTTYDTFEVPKVKMVSFEHTVKKGEGLFAIARSVRARAQKAGSKAEVSILKVQGMIQKQNGIKDPKKIRPGQKLKVELPLEAGASLTEIAAKHGKSVEELKKINPAVIKTKVALPQGAKIRIPK